MSVSAAVYSRLSGYAALTSLVPAARITPNRVPQASAFPAVRFQVIDSGTEHMMGSDSGVLETLVQVDSYATSSASALAVAAQVKAALSRFRGTSASVTVQDVFFTDERTLFEDRVGAEGLHRVMQMFTVWSVG